MDKIKFFQSFNFTEYESKIILSLLKLKIATTKQISFDSGVPQNKIYFIMKKFETVGIIEIIPKKINQFHLINLKEFINKKIKEKSEFLNSLKNSAKSIESKYSPSENSLFSMIKGQETVMGKISDHNAKVKKEILGVQRNWKVWGRGLREIQSAIKRGVVVKFIGIIDSETEKRALEWKKTGAKIRKYNKKFGEFPLRFTIFDNKDARITIGKPEISNPENYITLWTQSKPIINILRKQFLDMWKECRSF